MNFRHEFRGRKWPLFNNKMGANKFWLTENGVDGDVIGGGCRWSMAGHNLAGVVQLYPFSWQNLSTRSHGGEPRAKWCI